MMKAKLSLLVLVVVLAGCTDTADSVAREYRNTNNEVLDAMMMVTTDAHAGRMIARVFSNLGDRYDAIDKKIEIMRTNQEKKDLAKDFLASDGVHLYLSELPVCRQRYTLEITRLKNLRKQYLDRERELLIQRGDQDPKVDPKVVCPNLETLVVRGNTLEPLRKQLLKPEVIVLMSEFGGWKVPDYDKLLAKFNERRATFTPKRDINLAY